MLVRSLTNQPLGSNYVKGSSEIKEGRAPPRSMSNTDSDTEKAFAQVSVIRRQRYGGRIPPRSVSNTDSRTEKRPVSSTDSDAEGVPPRPVSSTVCDTERQGLYTIPNDDIFWMTYGTKTQVENVNGKIMHVRTVI